MLGKDSQDFSNERGAYYFWYNLNENFLDLVVTCLHLLLSNISISWRLEKLSITLKQCNVVFSLAGIHSFLQHRLSREQSMKADGMRSHNVLS